MGSACQGAARDFGVAIGNERQRAERDRQEREQHFGPQANRQWGLRHLFRSTSVSPDSRIGVLRHGVERRSNTLLARHHLSQLDRKAVHEARPRRQVRLRAHAVVDGVERDAEVAGGAGSDFGLGFDSRVVEIAATARARDRKSTRLNYRHANNSYSVFGLKKKRKATEASATSRLPATLQCRTYM